MSVPGTIGRIPVLFTRESGIYFELPNADPWPMSRDARKFAGTSAVVAHPPCRAWGRLRTFANPRPDEKDLARFAVSVIRANGGILEHPASSSLWPDMGLPSLGRFDSFGGFTVSMPQFWFGHPCLKPSWFYVVGCSPGQLPEIPFVLGEAEFVIGSRTDRPSYGRKKQLPASGREKTPARLASWLLAVATLIEAGKAVKVVS